MLLSELSPESVGKWWRFIECAGQPPDPNFEGFLTSMATGLSGEYAHYSVGDILGMAFVTIASLAMLIIQLSYIVFFLPRIGKFSPTRFILGPKLEQISRNPLYYLPMLFGAGPLIGLFIDWMFFGPLGILVLKTGGVDAVLFLRHGFKLIDCAVLVVLLPHF